MVIPYCVKCDIVMKIISVCKSIAITDTIYECPNCKYQIGIVIQNVIGENIK